MTPHPTSKRSMRAFVPVLAVMLVLTVSAWPLGGGRVGHDEPGSACHTHANPALPPTPAECPRSGPAGLLASAGVTLRLPLVVSSIFDPPRR